MGGSEDMVRKRRVKPLGKIETVGERGKNQSFLIRMHRGRYLYIRTEDFEQLKKINEAYKSIYETGVKPLEGIKIVGRGGYAGYRPFLLRGYEGRYLCILEEHLRQLGEINAAYGEFLEVEKRGEEERRRKELEEKRKGTKRELEDVKKLIEDVKAEGSLRYVPEMMDEIEKAFADARKAFDDAKYDKTLKLLPRIKGLAEQAKTETLKKAKEEEVRQKKLEEKRKKELKEKKERAKKELEKKKKDTEKGLDDIKKLIEDVKAEGSLRYVPEMMDELEGTFRDARKAFDTARYDKAFKLIPRIKGLAEQVKTETLKKVKEEEVRQKKLEEKRKKELKEKNEQAKRELEKKKKDTEKGLDDVEVLIEDVKAEGSLRYVPEMMDEIEKVFADARKAFDDAKYDKTLKLLPRIKGLAEQAKTETLKKAKEGKPEEGKYVYGIVPFVDGGISFGNVGIENNGNVYAINYKDVAAVVSDASVKDYILAEDYIRTHEDVVRTVLKDYSVVPAAFGQVFKNQKILRAVMRNAYKKLRECLKLVDDRIELGVKVILPKRVAESLDEQKKEGFRKNGEEIFALLNRRAENSVKGRLFSDRLALNASFLVDKENIEEFSEEVGRLSEEYGDLKIKYSGPWPPYSFVTIRIGPKGVEVGRREVT